MYLSTGAPICASDHVKSTSLATPDAPSAGESSEIAGLVPHSAAEDAVYERTGLVDVFVVSHAACATTNQNTRPGMFGTACVVAVIPLSNRGGGVVGPRERS